MSDDKLDAGVFDAIKVETPANIIVDQIRRLIADGTLKPGTRLPSERELSERFRVGRGHIRKALAKLEFYGILRTVPHRGTIVARIGVKAIEGLLSNILQLEKPDIRSLLETRAILESSAAALAAERGSPEELKDLAAALDDYRRKAEQRLPALEEDHLFHLKLAAMSGNSALLSLISLITPEIIAMNLTFKERDEARFQRTITEHEAIVRAVAARDPAAARAAMEVHMTESARRRLPTERQKPHRGGTV
ncbi:MAG TPA: FCD domain-containing protein [Spirochaetia bacterium]|nr:FCD domain-containing protein [Spirochaetia bacterium]